MDKFFICSSPLCLRTKFIYDLQEQAPGKKVENAKRRNRLDRETSLRYWLTVIAQDRGAVPLTSRLDVYVEVEDENDNIPLTFEPVYYPNIQKILPKGQRWSRWKLLTWMSIRSKNILSHHCW
ncbi:protocadherin Fat 1 [Caerostris extrusa]|uniref:Protocadherin Fat 1 n=1 Tax=Caerostris extrusa TaxID=172846 RepID=A0AAV4M531_CAEEX|nr:protocadherin Fat 1 [Caerostris extrusa]